MQTLLVLVSLLLPAQASRPVDLKNLPADWPPLPDFKHTVDYVKWWEERVNGGITDDARPLWDELSGNDNASEEAQEAHEPLWGENRVGVLPGLFTSAGAGFDPEPWDPQDHPDWEKAYQLQQKYGLVRKLREAAAHRQLSMRLRVPKEDDLTELAFTAEDHLVLRCDLCPHLSTMRQATKVLLQNAWRAPAGKVDPESMRLAIITCLQIAAQARSRQLSTMDLLVAVAIRKMAYDTLFEALDKSAIGVKDAAEIEKWLAQNDNQSLSALPCYAGELAILCDLLQFGYLPEEAAWPQPPGPNMENIKKLSAWAQIMSDTAKHLTGVLGETAVLNLTEEIARCDPDTGVRQLADLFLKCRHISEQELPWSAAQNRQRAWRQLSDDSHTHVILRQFCTGFNLPELIVAASETSRRATRIVLALHRHHNRTGRWPTRLSEFRPLLPPSIRTDPFSGKPFIYRLENGQPLLYSTGYNAKDDGGKHKPYPRQEEEKDGVSVAVEADYVYWAVQREK